jgi:CHASE3 domain sensor protein
MSAFANLPISRKLMAAFAAVVVVIFASSAIVFDRLRVIEWAHDWRVHTIDVLDTLQNAMDAMLDQETGLRGYLITGDENFLEPYHRGGNAYTAASQKIRDLTSDNPARQSRTSDNPAQQSRLDELNELARKWRSGFAERAIALMAKFETREDARALEGSTAGKTAMDLIRAKVHEIEGAERDLLAKRDAVQSQAFATAYMMTIVGGAASLIIATLMGVLLTPLAQPGRARSRRSPGCSVVHYAGRQARGRSDRKPPCAGKKIRAPTRDARHRRRHPGNSGAHPQCVDAAQCCSSHPSVHRRSDGLRGSGSDAASCAQSDHERQ